MKEKQKREKKKFRSLTRIFKARIMRFRSVKLSRKLRDGVKELKVKLDAVLSKFSEKNT